MSMHIKKRTKYNGVNYFTLKVIMCFLVVRIFIIVLSGLLNTTPFLCYDDLNIYDKITSLYDFEIRHWFNFRNCYYWICTVFNNIRIGEVLTGTRILNTVLWFITCFNLKSIVTYLGYSNKSVKIITLFMAVSPVYAFYSMVPLREVLCAWTVVSLIELFLKYEINHEISWIKICFFSVLLFFVRTGVLEMMLVVFWGYKFKDGKAHIKILLGILTLVLLTYFMTNENYMYVLNNKFENYLSRESALHGMLSLIEVKKPLDFYKFVLLIPYVQLIPLPGTHESFYTQNSWSNWITMFACLQAFVFPFFWKYVIRGKKSVLEKLVLLFYFIALIILSLSQPNNSRFFFFISPIYYIFGLNSMVLSLEKSKRNIIGGCLFAILPYVYLLV